MKLNKKSAMAVAAVSASALVAVPAAFATTGLVVDGSSVPGTVVITADVTSAGVSFSSDWDVPVRCSSSDIMGTVNRGAAMINGSTIGQITDLTFSNCLMDHVYPLAIKKNTNVGAPASWPIELVGTPSKGQNIVPIVIRDVNAKIHSTTPAVPSATTPWTCHMDATGDVAGTFNQATQQIGFVADGTFPLALRPLVGTSATTNVTSGAGTCVGTFQPGDNAEFGASFDVDTPGTGGITY
jgi:hypothetical protein